MVRKILALGPTNPVAVRLVQNGSRRKRHFYIRAGYLAALIVVLMWSLVATTEAGDLSYRDLAAAGARSFTWVAYLQVLLICLLAPVFMAGAIAQESNPKTWDILLTTPLSPLQIVSGNLFGRLFFVLALLAASLPLFSLTQYFGGVPGSSILASYAISACAAVVVGAIAVALSVSRVVGRRAVFAFYVAVVSYLAVTIAIDVWIRRATSPGVTPMTAINPFLAMFAVFNPANYPRGGPEASWFLRSPVMAWCVLSLSLSFVLTFLSALTVRGGGLANMITPAGGVPLHRRILGLGSGEHRPPRPVWTNPIAWREAAARNATLGRILARWSFIALGGLFAVGLIGAYHFQRIEGETFRFIMLVAVWTELAVVTLVAINMSATAVTREREDGTLDLLLTTPITPEMYLSGKLRGMVAYLLPMAAVPVGTLAMAGVYVGFGGFGRDGGAVVGETINQQPVEVPVVLPEALFAAPVAVLPFIAFCVMIGLHWSVKSRGTLSAVISTFGVVAAIAGMAGLCGWKSGTDFEALGPAFAGMSPATVVYALIDPAHALEATAQGESSLLSARVSLLVGVVIGALVHLGLVYALHSAMSRGFDMTVRRLAGLR